MLSQTNKPYWDYWLEAVRISHYCPGLGNPWDLTLAQWNAVLARLEDLKEELNPIQDDEHLTQTTLRMAAQQERTSIRRQAFYG